MQPPGFGKAAGKTACAINCSERYWFRRILRRMPESARLAGFATRVQKNFSGLAGFEKREGGCVIVDRDAFIEQRIKVEALFFEQVGHLDPSLKHFAAVDALHGGALEN